MQSCCRTYPHAFVILFDDGSHGVQSVIEPDVFGLYIDALQVIISPGPYVAMRVFADNAYVFIRMYILTGIQSRCKISCL